MRRALLTRLPQLSRIYGLKPWDLEDLSVRELSEYLVDLDRLIAEANRTA